MSPDSRRGPHSGEVRVVGGSFRDPAGFVFERDGVLYRQVNRSFAEAFDRFMSSGLHEALTAEGLLVPHEEADLSVAATEDAHRVLRPEPVPFISYPYEWCFGELKDAALCTLRAQRLALDRGFTLRDASAFNVQFRDGRPVLIDTLSFEPVREGEPWAAYRQFCEHFLAPLALMSYRDVRLGELLRVHIDGVPLDLAATLLPRRARLRGSLLLHLFAHARSQRRHGGDGGKGRGDRRFTRRAFRGLLDSLESAVRRLAWEPPRSAWVTYYGECGTYSPEALARKEEIVARFLEEAAPGTVWDLGANTGRFSRVAAALGAFTVSLDGDPGATEASYRETVRNGETRILPLVVDLANPSPGLGWGNRERMTLQERGPADLVMALALVHHVAIGGNVPLERLVAFLRSVGAGAIVEFVPKSDPGVRDLLSVRDDVFPGYTPEGFERAAAERFEVVAREAITGSDRTLYLLRGR